MRVLADLRSRLSEPVPAALDPGSRLVVQVDPAWRTRPPAAGAERDGILLVLRHRGLGWLGFLLPRAKAAALGRSLVRLARRRPPPPAAPTPA